VSVTPVNIAPVENSAFNGKVASYNGTCSSLLCSATITWGDGHTSAGTVTGVAPNFSISGVNTYVEDGLYSITTTVTDNSSTFTGVGQASVQEALLTTAPVPVPNIPEGLPLTATVGSFSDPGSPDAAASYTASIKWGDGVTSTGTIISGSPGNFTILGSHTYNDEGTFTITSTVAELNPSSTAVSVTTQVTTFEADFLTATPKTINGTEGTSFTGPVATFTDTFVPNTPADFTVTIAWGDTTSSPGTVAGGGGAFTVTGPHTYAKQGVYTFTVTVMDDAPGSATATATGTATIADAPLSGTANSLTPVAGVALTNVHLATFTDLGKQPLSAYTATINWGDGSPTSTGTLTDPPSVVNVFGSHTYAAVGSHTLTVTLVASDDASATVTATVTVSAPLPATAAPAKPLPLVPAGLLLLSAVLLSGAVYLRRRSG
jgi:hypothetical protein